jgi:deoxyxylulose-5-phosphate synthase
MKKIVAISAAMSEGTGLDRFSEQFRTAFFDVWIAESLALPSPAVLPWKDFISCGNILNVYAAGVRRWCMTSVFRTFR